MFDEPFRLGFARLMRPIAHALGRLGVTPNHVTIATFVIAVCAAVLVGSGYPHVGLALWLISRIGDGLDGVLARVTASSTPFGGYLDITLDMGAYTGMVLGFASLHPERAFGWAAVLAGYVVVITSTLALSDAAGALGRQVSQTERTFQLTPGIAEAGETSVMYVLWVLFPEHVGWLVWVWFAVLIATSVQRTHLAWRALR